MIPLAEPVRVRLAAWLDQRAAKWRRTLNPHLFVKQYTAPRLLPPGHQFPWMKAGGSAQALRTDRISDLFGIGIDSVVRYLRILDLTMQPPD
jgi:hypothetical protein